MGVFKVILLDTHVWIWWLSHPDKLSKKALAAINSAIPATVVYISSISIWEIAVLVKKGRLQLRIDVSDWIKHAESLPFFYFVPVNNHIAIKSVYLKGELHDDPADRIIIATAMTTGASLVTKDERMHIYKHVDTIW